MIAELNELKWLLLPLYPFIVCILFGVWLFARFRRSKRFQLRANFLGVSLEIAVDEAQSEGES